MLQEKFEQADDEQSRLVPSLLPDLIQISIKGFKNDVEIFQHNLGINFCKILLQISNVQDTTDSKQIPILSDIERIKKVVEILEFVGEKVEAIIENLPTSQALSEDEPKTEVIKDVEQNVVPTPIDTTLETTNIA